MEDPIQLILNLFWSCRYSNSVFFFLSQYNHNLTSTSKWNKPSSCPWSALKQQLILNFLHCLTRILLKINSHPAVNCVTDTSLEHIPIGPSFSLPSSCLVSSEGLPKSSYFWNNIYLVLIGKECLGRWCQPHLWKKSYYPVTPLWRCDLLNLKHILLLLVRMSVSFCVEMNWH